MDFLKNITPRKYQKEIFETCKNKNCLIVLPTGLGKTLIALMIAIDRIKKFPREKVLFLAPTKPLVEQQANYFKKHLPELFGEITIFTGSINTQNRKKLWDISDLIFSTPQCIANDLKKRTYNLSEVCLLIEDEAHRCIKNYDYNFVAQKYISQGKNKRIIGMTASPGSEHAKIKEICKNLSIEEVELRTRDSEDVKKYLQELEIEKRTIDFPAEFLEIREILKDIFYDYTKQLKENGLFYGIPSKAGLINFQKKIMQEISRGKKSFKHFFSATTCAQAIKIQHALGLLETQTLISFNDYLKELFKQARSKKSKGIVKLTSRPDFNLVYVKSNELLSRNIEHPKVEELTQIIKKEKSKKDSLKVIVFTQFRNTAITISKKINELEGIIAGLFVGQAKVKGRIGETGMNQKEQKEMVKKFSEGEVNVLCATSIGEEGLDIPEVDLVIFYETVPSAIRKIQRSGRTARIQSGKIIMLITKDTRDETFYYVSNAREKKMKNTIEKIKQELSNKEKQKEIKDFTN